MNGYSLECFSGAWADANPAQSSAAGWRGVFDAYRSMQATSRRPRINILEGCGVQNGSDPNRQVPTADDLRTHRLALGTTLLSDGFYSFDLVGGASTVPLWYDEYSVDAQGNAIEDRTKKGYLGSALTDAVELADGGSVVLQETFDSATLLPAFRANPTARFPYRTACLPLAARIKLRTLRSTSARIPMCCGLTLERIFLLSNGNFSIRLTTRSTSTLWAALRVSGCGGLSPVTRARFTFPSRSKRLVIGRLESALRAGERWLLTIFALSGAALAPGGEISRRGSCW